MRKNKKYFYKESFFFVLAAFYLMYSFGCDSKTKPAEIPNKDTFEISFYNNVLEELVKENFYLYYLNYFEDSVSKLIDDNMYKKTIDSLDYSVKMNELIEQVISDSSKQCNLFIDTADLWSPEFNNLFEKISDTSTSRFSTKLKSLIEPFIDNKNGNSIIDSLNSVQKRYSYNDFNLKICKVKDASTYNDFENECKIGSIRISKTFMDSTKNKALLYYEFYCGSKCGMGYLVLFEFIDGKWVIKDGLQFWVS